MAKVLGSTTLHEGWSTFRQVRFELDDGQVVERSVEHHGDAAVVLPYDPDRRVAILVRQFRAPAVFKGREPPLEAPAGIIDPGETPAESGRREVMEETGVKVRDLEPLGRFWSSPGSSTEEAWLFLAPYRAEDRVADGGGADEHEDVEVMEVPLARLSQMLAAGQITDVKLLALTLSLMRRRPELFG